jgi:hypothetical protein
MPTEAYLDFDNEPSSLLFLYQSTIKTTLYTDNSFSHMAERQNEFKQRFRWRTIGHYCYYVSDFLEIGELYENMVQNITTHSAII